MMATRFTLFNEGGKGDALAREHRDALQRCGDVDTRRSGPNMCWSRTFQAAGSSGKSKNIGRSGGAPVALKSAIRRITYGRNRSRVDRQWRRMPST